MFEDRWKGTLCDAIDRLKVVQIKYDDDLIARDFAPDAVYRNDKYELLVDGIQLHNPAEPTKRNVPRNFFLNKITSVAITSKSYDPNPSFDPRAERYKSGIICSVRR